MAKVMPSTKDLIQEETAMEAVKKDDSKARIAELEAQLKAFDKKSEEAALARVCKALGVEPSDVSAKEEEASKVQMVRMFIQSEVSINGEKYVGDRTVPIGTARVIQQALGDRRQRLLRELTGNNYILQQLEGGGFAPKLVGQVNPDTEISAVKV